MNTKGERIVTKWRRSVVVVVAVTVLTMSVMGLVFPSPPAQARPAVTSNPTPTPTPFCAYQLLFDGILTPPTVGIVHGAQAVIYNYFPEVCGQFSGSSSWAFAAIENLNQPEIAQVGWVMLTQWSTSDVYFFWEWGDGTQIFSPQQGSKDTQADNYGTTNHFTVIITTPHCGNGSINFVRMEMNGSTLGSACLGWTPYAGGWLGETHSTNDFVPGGIQHNVIFSSVQHAYNGVWYNENTQTDLSLCNGGSPPPTSCHSAPDGQISVVNGNWFHIWDDRVN